MLTDPHDAIVVGGSFAGLSAAILETGLEQLLAYPTAGVYARQSLALA